MQDFITSTFVAVVATVAYATRMMSMGNAVWVTMWPVSVAAACSFVAFLPGLTKFWKFPIGIDAGMPDIDVISDAVGSSCSAFFRVECIILCVFTWAKPTLPALRKSCDLCLPRLLAAVPPSYALLRGFPSSSCSGLAIGPPTFPIW
jgi:hypothetical protein